MKQFKVKYWTGKRYPGGPAIFYYLVVAAPDQEEAANVAKDYYIVRYGQDNFILHSVEPYVKPNGYVISEGPQDE